MDQLAIRLGFPLGDREAWYRVTHKIIVDNGASGILKRYRQSIPQMISSIYPEFQWDPLKFVRAPRNFWSSKENHRAFLDQLGIKLGIHQELLLCLKFLSYLLFVVGISYSNRAGWYKISSQQVIDHGGNMLLQKYSMSLSKALLNVYPDFAWDALQFSKAPQNYWDSIENQRTFLDDLGKKLGFKEGEREGWYAVQNKTVLENGGSRILFHYQNSMIKMLANVYPEYDWKLWKFSRRSGRVRDNPSAMAQLLDTIEPQLGIRSPEDWYRVSSDQLSSIGIARIIKSKANLFNALKQKYPAVEWRDDLLQGKAPPKR